MNLLEKLKTLPKDKLDEIRIFVDNLDDVFLSPSGKKLILGLYNRWFNVLYI